MAQPMQNVDPNAPDPRDHYGRPPYAIGPNARAVRRSARLRARNGGQLGALTHSRLAAGFNPGPRRRPGGPQSMYRRLDEEQKKEIRSMNWAEFPLEVCRIIYGYALHESLQFTYTFDNGSWRRCLDRWKEFMPGIVPFPISLMLSHRSAHIEMKKIFAERARIQIILRTLKDNTRLGAATAYHQKDPSKYESPHTSSSLDTLFHVDHIRSLSLIIKIQPHFMHAAASDREWLQFFRDLRGLRTLHIMICGSSHGDLDRPQTYDRVRGVAGAPPTYERSSSFPLEAEHAVVKGLLFDITSHTRPTTTVSFNLPPNLYKTPPDFYIAAGRNPMTFPADMVQFNNQIPFWYRPRDNRYEVGDQATHDGAAGSIPFYEHKYGVPNDMRLRAADVRAVYNKFAALKSSQFV